MSGTAPPQKPTSTWHCPEAACRLAASAAIETVGGKLFSGMSMIVVIPPAAAARVAVANPSQSVRPGSFTCTCGSTNPGNSARSPRSCPGCGVRLDRRNPAVADAHRGGSDPLRCHHSTRAQHQVVGGGHCGAHTVRGRSNSSSSSAPQSRPRRRKPISARAVAGSSRTPATGPPEPR